MKKIPLEVELIPQSCWFSNVRSVVSKQQWDLIRHRVYSQAWGVCQICGEAPHKSLEAHEIWEYDDNLLIQKLIGMIALCSECHAVKHFGYTSSQGHAKEALHHLMKVNNLNLKQADQYLIEAFTQWNQRSQKQWKLDIIHLIEYGIDIDKIGERK